MLFKNVIESDEEKEALTKEIRKAGNELAYLFEKVPAGSRQETSLRDLEKAVMMATKAIY